MRREKFSDVYRNIDKVNEAFEKAIIGISIDKKSKENLKSDFINHVIAGKINWRSKLTTKTVDGRILIVEQLKTNNK